MDWRSYRREAFIIVQDNNTTGYVLSSGMNLKIDYYANIIWSQFSQLEFHSMQLCCFGITYGTLNKKMINFNTGINERFERTWNCGYSIFRSCRGLGTGGFSISMPPPCTEINPAWATQNRLSSHKQHIIIRSVDDLRPVHGVSKQFMITASKKGSKGTA